MITVKDRRIDLRWKMAEKEPYEIEQVCQVILQERKREMQERTRKLMADIGTMFPGGFLYLRTRCPEVVARFLDAMEKYDAQALRWVYDECSPVVWQDSDAYRAAAELGAAGLELQQCGSLKIS